SPLSDFFTDTPDYYATSYDNELCDRIEVMTVGSIAVPVFYSVVVVLSFIGNILVIVILALFENFKSLQNTFILNLALSDLMFTAGLPFWAYYLIWGWTLGDTMCKAVKFVFSAGFYSSTLFLMLMTIQRFLAVVRPLADRGENRPCLAGALSILVWILSASASIPALVHSKVMLDTENEEERPHCEFDTIEMKHAIIYLQNTIFLISFAIMGFCYGNILRIVLVARKSRKHRTVILIFIIVMVFFIGWAPYNIILYVTAINEVKDIGINECGSNDALYYALLVCEMLAFSHCCLNPIFYAFVGVKFRNHFKVILHKLLHTPLRRNSRRTRMTTSL
ncbi:chemokine XC receptor 1-like, partial [Chanos chanos]|uniref:Chemokine XC receptor 1-like n=1 Tax=Chanos chanos TaxID=29144 RepID=A0A6J2WB52_CHACN